MNKIDITGWVLITLAILLITSTVRIQDMDPSVRVKAETTGGSVTREIGYENKITVQITSAGFLCAGLSCFLVESGLRKLKKKRKQRNHQPAN